MEIKRTIGITKEGGMGVYLGLPEKICGSKKKVFARKIGKTHQFLVVKVFI